MHLTFVGEYNIPPRLPVHFVTLHPVLHPVTLHPVTLHPVPLHPVPLQPTKKTQSKYQ